MFFKRQQLAIPSPCFISQSYRDGLAKSAAAALPRGVLPIIFPPIEVSPREFVSDELIAALNKAKSVLVADGPGAKESFWVAFETYFASRNGKPIFRFDPEAATIAPDRHERPDPPIFASYPGRSASGVEKISKWLQEKRGFKVWRTHDVPTGVDLAEEVEQGLSATLGDGGFVVAFISSETAQSKVMSHELNYALDRFPDQIFFACLGEPEAVLPDFIKSKLNAYQDKRPVWLLQLSDASGASDFGQVNLNRLDDLMVRVLYLVHQRQAASVSSVAPF